MTTKINAYEAYALHTALKNHFTRPSYDYFKYHGKTQTSLLTFGRRKDKGLYTKLAKLFNSKEELEAFIVANLIAGREWVGDLFEEEALENYKAFTRRNGSISYFFFEDMNVLLSQNSFDSLFKSNANEYPPIINSYLSGEISIQTLAILESIFNYSEALDRRLSADDIIWGKIRLTVRKVSPFLVVDYKTVKKRLLSLLSDVAQDNLLG